MIDWTDYNSELLELSESLDIDFIGMIKEVGELNNIIVNSELFVFASSFEAMSMMLIEVVSLKVPMICSDIPENTSIFNDNEMTFFETDNVNDLAEKLLFAENNIDVF